ncbi:MAG: hypothetical protein EWV40_17635 [Microcystis flos-aquae Mf_WU_F_19750830_S460]|uniref:Uncharacterized protein n=1 Tax=Microcystis flos-aquae Mf_WU_F_19750830_S460 TaxID=2486237 RepID=A0A552LDM1_9CHRO|nr:MAG: hypothetical protein EWV40_17635 [Microcystis flos-aquae Mf_WU_F_19750830_S460]
MISLTYYRSDQSLCPLCLEWFLPLPRQQDCILEYILPTKPKRASDLSPNFPESLISGSFD